MSIPKKFELNHRKFLSCPTIVWVKVARAFPSLLLLHKRLEFGLNCFHFDTLVACGKEWPAAGWIDTRPSDAHWISSSRGFI